MLYWSHHPKGRRVDEILLTIHIKISKKYCPSLMQIHVYDDVTLNVSDKEKCSGGEREREPERERGRERERERKREIEKEGYIA